MLQKISPTCKTENLLHPAYSWVPYSTRKRWFNKKSWKKHSFIIVRTYRIEGPWGFQASPSYLLLLPFLSLLLLIWLFAINWLLVECQLVSVFLNHLSFVNQGTGHEYMGCGRFSVLLMNTNLLQHFLIAWLCNLHICLYCYISSHLQSQTACFVNMQT